MMLRQLCRSGQRTDNPAVRGNRGGCLLGCSCNPPPAGAVVVAGSPPAVATRLWRIWQSFSPGMRPAVRPCHSTRYAGASSVSVLVLLLSGHKITAVIPVVALAATHCLPGAPRKARCPPTPSCAPHLHSPCIACLRHHRRHCQEPQSCSTPNHGRLAGACDLCFVVG